MPRRVMSKTQATSAIEPQRLPGLTTFRVALSRFLEGRGAVAVPIILAGAALAYPWLGLASPFWVREISLIAIYALIVSGLNLSFGFAGELQFSQVAMFALGAYITGSLAFHGFNHIIPLLLLSGVAASLLGGLISIPAMRVAGWSLGMVSFFLVLLIPDVLNILPPVWTGAGSGLTGIPLPTLFGHTLGNQGFYVAVILVTIIWYALFRNLVTSRYGNVFKVIRDSPVLATSLGFSVRPTKIYAYMLGAFPAGLAGCFFAYINQSISPDSFALSAAIGIVAASVLGGTESVYGAVVGAAVLQLGPLESTSFDQYSLIVYGVFLIVVAVLFRSGLRGIGLAVTGRTARLVRPDNPRTVTAKDPAEVDLTLGAIDGRRLSISSVSVEFGGVQALQDVSIACEPGRITALIGANGSGKTTMLNLISGFVKPVSGSIVLGDAELIGQRAHRRSAKFGVARTFQTPLIPRGMTVAEVVATGRYATNPCGMLKSTLRLKSYWRTRRQDRAAAMGLLRIVRLADLADDPATSLPLGSRRMVEVARCMSGQLSVLLFDEPASGLSSEEVQQLGEILRALANAGATVVLVEHNFRFVLEIADRIHVLELGQLIASGSSSEIEADPRVAESYLGRAAAAEIGA